MINQSWQPTASLKNLQLRAEIFQKIRAFFAERKVLEVETPLLSHATVTDLHLQSFITHYHAESQLEESEPRAPASAHPSNGERSLAAQKSRSLYLQTSPEYAMKRLLASGSGAIYQICKAFRNDGEFGRFHNPEFTMLEWYRPGFDHHELMNEVDELLKAVLNTQPAERVTYSELFARYVGIDPHTASFDGDRNHHLQLIMNEKIEPHLGRNQPTFVYDFPATQAALAKIRPGNPPVAERFEVYIEGIELANGFHELTDAHEQQQRFHADLLQRQKINYPPVPIDEHLLAALQHGLPHCAGIALGIDRLVMIAAKAKAVEEVISFPLERA
jgi:lysyl-tRNA synthetase class 2